MILTTLTLMLIAQHPVSVLPPTTSLHLTGAKARRMQRFLTYASEQAALAFQAKNSRPAHLQIHLREFREASLLHNIVGSIGGGIINDTGHFALDLLLLEPTTKSPITTFSIQSTTSIKTFFLANAFSRQSILRNSFRRQVRKLSPP